MNSLLHTPIDKWSIREKLSLASSVQSAGDQNWYSVSRSLKPFGEPNRPSDWFSQKNCALQYAELLENVEAPKRKRGEKKDTGEKEDTAQNLIVRKLTLERIGELKVEIECYQEQLQDLRKNISLLKNDNLSETDMKIIEGQMIEQLNQKRVDEEEHLRWLKEREEKYLSMSRKKSIVNIKMPPRKDHQTPSDTPTSLANKSVAGPEDGQQTNKSASTEDLQSKAIKQENISAQEAANEQPSVRTTRERSKEQEKMQVVVISEERLPAEKQAIEPKPVEPAKPVQEPASISAQEAANELPPVRTMPVRATPVKMDLVEKDEGRSVVESSESRPPEEPERGREESIASNKRKRTSTSSNVSASNIVQQPPAQQPAQTPPATQTRRSGRISKPLRPSLALSAPTTPKPDSVEQQQKRTQIDESNIIAPVNASQLLLNTDDSTKDSTTSDVTDTYTSPNSPASSILNIDHTDPEQVREQKEYKAWRRSIYLLLKQAQTHKFSSLFLSPVTDDEAKGYSTVVYRPIDLTIIRRKIENGTIKTTGEFQRDIMLMFQNAIMYNSVKHEVHQMTLEMQKEILEAIDDFVSEQKTAKEQLQQFAPAPAPKETPAAPVASSISASSRRKSRTLS